MSLKPLENQNSQFYAGRGQTRSSQARSGDITWARPSQLRGPPQTDMPTYLIKLSFKLPANQASKRLAPNTLPEPCRTISHVRIGGEGGGDGGGLRLCPGCRRRRRQTPLTSSARLSWPAAATARSATFGACRSPGHDPHRTVTTALADVTHSSSEDGIMLEGGGWIQHHAHSPGLRAAVCRRAVG